MAMKGVELGNVMLQADANKLKKEQYEYALAQRNAFNADVASLGDNPTPDQYSALMRKYPQMAETLKTNYDILSSEQQQYKLSNATKIYAALSSGQNDVALQMLEEQQLAAENAGNKQMADEAKALAMLVQNNPQAARLTAGLFLSTTAGPDKFAETWQKINQSRIDTDLAKPQLDKAKAEAATAAIDARFAELKPAMDAAAAGLDISFMIADPNLKKLNTALAVKNKEIQKLEAQNRQNEAETLRLQVAELRFKQDQAAQELLDNAQSDLSKSTDAVAAIEDVINLGNVDVGFGRTAIDAATGSLEGIQPAFGANEDVANFINALDTVQAQVFMDGVAAMRGLGALTGPEGERIERLLGSLDRTQSSDRLMGTLENILEIFKRGQTKLESKYGNYQQAVEAYNQSRATGAQAQGVDVRAQADAILRGE